MTFTRRRVDREPLPSWETRETADRFAKKGRANSTRQVTDFLPALDEIQNYPYLFVKNFGRLNVIRPRPSSWFRKKRLKTSFRRESCPRYFKTLGCPKILRSWNRKPRFLSVIKSTNIFRSIESLSRCFVRQQLSIHLAIITCTFLSSKQPGFASTIGR